MWQGRFQKFHSVCQCVVVSAVDLVIVKGKMVALTGFVGQMYVNVDYGIYCVDLNGLHADYKIITSSLATLGWLF